MVISIFSASLLHLTIQQIHSRFDSKGIKFMILLIRKGFLKVVALSVSWLSLPTCFNGFFRLFSFTSMSGRDC